MAVPKLTADFVKRAIVETGKERTVFWDDKLSGFGVMVTERGHKSYVVQHRTRHRSRHVTINSVLSLDDARKQARDILGQISRGGNPATEKRRAADAERDVLRAIINEFFEREGHKLRAATKRHAVLERLVVPKLGSWSSSDPDRLLDEIEDNTARRWHSRCWHNRMARVPGMSKLFLVACRRAGTRLVRRRQCRLPRTRPLPRGRRL
jgi:hypothetical protein